MRILPKQVEGDVNDTAETNCRTQSARVREHPYDAKALNALQATPGLHHLVRSYHKHIFERESIIIFTGSHLRITPDAYPEIYSTLDQACGTINLPERPSLYLKHAYDVNGGTSGVDNPYILLTSKAIDLLDPAELLFLVGHEIGHLKSRHVLYREIALSLRGFAADIGEMTLGIGKYISQPLLYAFFWWMRMSEFTADRAGLLTCQDPDASTCFMMKLAGMPTKYSIGNRQQAFLEQSREFQNLNYDKLNAAWKWMNSLKMTHPWTVLRAAELLRWVESGEYQAVLDRKTAQLPRPSAAPANAYCHNCGGPLRGEEAFCPACGQKLLSSSET